MMNKLNYELLKPVQMGSYSPEDVVFLLKDLSYTMTEDTTEHREQSIQSGVHYSEMLPIEYKPTEEYLKLFHQSLNDNKRIISIAVGVVAEQIIKQHGKDTVLVSLARAGTPIGILIKRYILYKYGIHLPHYSISIIRDRGIDENAILYILKNHPNQTIQFIDGWTGKGAITQELQKACQQYNQKYGIHLNPELAVLADPGHCAHIYGTREDFLISSACLNSTVSGLVSRTVLNQQYIQKNDFHGAKYYKELESEDLSNYYIDTTSNEFHTIEKEIQLSLDELDSENREPTWKGLKDIQVIQNKFGIQNINLIKPGVGETTRVLLRRVPWKILVKRKDDKRLEHILLLAKDRGVPIEIYPEMAYSCCGLIKPLNQGEKI